MDGTDNATDEYTPPTHPPLSSHQPPTICHTHLQPQVYFILSTQQQTTRLSPLYFIMITIIMLIIIMTCWLRMSTTDHDYAAAAASALTTATHHPTASKCHNHHRASTLPLSSVRIWPVINGARRDLGTLTRLERCRGDYDEVTGAGRQAGKGNEKGS